MPTASVLNPGQLDLLNRFVATCAEDPRIVAAFLSGSNARGAADVYSDLDIDVVTTDSAFQEFCDEREAFMQSLGEPILLQKFDTPDYVFFVYADGTEGELAVGREGDLTRLHSGPLQVLLDKKGILSSTELPLHQPATDAQLEKLHAVLYGFWHDYSHLLTALARNQLWWAQGQLDQSRHACVKLVRFQNDLYDAEASDEAYFKVDTLIPASSLIGLEKTFVPLDGGAMLGAAKTILEFYKRIATDIADKYDMPYPTRLEELNTDRLEKLL